MDTSLNPIPREASATVGDAFRHEAFLYAGIDEFVDGVTTFVAEGVARGEPALVVVEGEKGEALRSALDAAGSGDGVVVADMDRVGHNPARIIPAWRAFVDAHGGAGPVRGVGEPIGPERRGAELVECELHESLLNVAFGDGPPWWLLCPYDVMALDADVIERACQQHPFLSREGARGLSPLYRRSDLADRPPGDPLPLPPAAAERLHFDIGPLQAVRRFVGRIGAALGLAAERTTDLMLAVDEIVANSMRHGPGAGVLYLWREGATVLAEVRDRGKIADPLVGRRAPDGDSATSRGFWIVHQLCDLVQVRSGPTGTTVRLHMALA